MNEPVWVTEALVTVIHAEQLARHGGGAGVRDKGLLESAIQRPQMKFHYGADDPATLAAAYAYGIARNHPFIDGNKRTAFVTMETFLRLNGLQSQMPHAEAVVTFLALAAGELEEEELAAWIRSHLAPWPGR